MVVEQAALKSIPGCLYDVWAREEGYRYYVITPSEEDYPADLPAGHVAYSEGDGLYYTWFLSQRFPMD